MIQWNCKSAKSRDVKKFLSFSKIECSYLSWKAAWSDTMKLHWGSAFTTCSAWSSENNIVSPVWCFVTLYLLISLIAYHVRFWTSMPERTLPNPPSPMRALKIIESLSITQVCFSWLNSVIEGVGYTVHSEQLGVKEVRVVADFCDKKWRTILYLLILQFYASPQLNFSWSRPTCDSRKFEKFSETQAPLNDLGLDGSTDYYHQPRNPQYYAILKTEGKPYL